MAITTTLSGFSGSPLAWTRVLHTTLNKILPDIEECSFREHPIGMLMWEGGRITRNSDFAGLGLVWTPQYRNHPVTVNTGENPRVPSRQNLHLQAGLTIKGYQCGDAVSELERVQNRGKYAIVKVSDRMRGNLINSMHEAFAEELYTDGSAAATSGHIDGLETMFATDSGKTIDMSQSGASSLDRAYNAADYFYDPSDTYANLSTALGAFGGTQNSGIWPFGKADPELDFWAPLVANALCTGYNAATNYWADTCVQVIRTVKNLLARNKGVGNREKVCITNAKMFTELCTKQDSKERVMVSNVGTKLRQFGFETVSQEGLDVVIDYGCGSDLAYIVSLSNMELHCAYDDVFKLVADPDDFESKSSRWNLEFLGNLQFKSPKHFAKIANTQLTG